MKLKTGLKWLGICSEASCREHGTQPAGFHKSRQFLDQIKDYQIIKKKTAAWTSFVRYINITLDLRKDKIFRCLFNTCRTCELHVHSI
jgi:hypothetical protein